MAANAYAPLPPQSPHTLCHHFVRNPGRRRPPEERETRNAQPRSLSPCSAQQGWCCITHLPPRSRAHRHQVDGDTRGSETAPPSAQTHVLCKITSDPAVNVCFAGVGCGHGLATSLPPSSISVHTHWPVCSPAEDVPRNPQPDTLTGKSVGLYRPCLCPQ